MEERRMPYHRRVNMTVIVVLFVVTCYGQLVGGYTPEHKVTSQCLKEQGMSFVSLYCGFGKVVRVVEAYHGAHRDGSTGCGHVAGDCHVDVKERYDWSRCETRHNCVQLIQRLEDTQSACAGMRASYLHVQYTCVDGEATSKKPMEPVVSLSKVSEQKKKIMPLPIRNATPEMTIKAANICLNKTLHHSQLYIQSPGYPRFYPSGLDCHCEVRAHAENSITVRFDDVRLVAPSVPDPSVSNPSVPNPSVQEPDVPNPGVSNPSVSNPSVSNPSVPDPSVSNPSVSNPSVSNPSVSNPSVPEPGVSNPSVSNPSVSNPSVPNPGVPALCDDWVMLAAPQYAGAGVVVCQDAHGQSRSLQSRSSHIDLHLHTQPGHGVHPLRGFRVLVTGSGQEKLDIDCYKTSPEVALAALPPGVASVDPARPYALPPTDLGPSRAASGRSGAGGATCRSLPTLLTVCLLGLLSMTHVTGSSS